MFNAARAGVVFGTIVAITAFYMLGIFAPERHERVRRQLAEGIPTRCIASGLASISIDGGPTIHAKDTLAALDAAGIKATFHVETNYIQNEPFATFAAEIVRRGHVLGMQFFPSVPLQNLDDTDLRDLLREGSEKIKRVTGKYPRFVRLKNSETNAAQIDRVEQYGYTVTGYNVDTQDYFSSVTNAIYRYKSTFESLGGIKSSFIFLQSGIIPIADIIEGGVAEGKKHGYQFVHIADCIGAQGLYKTGVEATSYESTTTTSGGGSGSGTGGGATGTSSTASKVVFNSLAAAVAVVALVL